MLPDFFEADFFLTCEYFLAGILGSQEWEGSAIQAQPAFEQIYLFYSANACQELDQCRRVRISTKRMIQKRSGSALFQVYEYALVVYERCTLRAGALVRRGTHPNSADKNLIGGTAAQKNIECLVLEG